MRANCSALMAEYRGLQEAANLNNTTAADMVGISRSRYAQLANSDDYILQTHHYLNLLWSIKVLKDGLEDGSLPLSSARGDGQQEFLDRLKKLT